MKINIEEYLYKIDESFKSKKQSDIIGTYVMIIGLLGFISYWFLFDNSLSSLKKSQTSVKSIEKKISVDTQYLQINPEDRIVQLESEAQSLEVKFSEFKDSNAYIKYQIEQIAELYYDEQTWGEYIDSISKSAQSNRIRLKKFTNAFADDKTAFGHVLDITIDASGSFKNMIKFIDSLEQSFLVVDLHDYSLKSEDKLNAELKISVWGITY